MAKQRMIVTDDQLLIDMDLLFSAIREADGNWQQVEAEMKQYWLLFRRWLDSVGEE